MTTTDDDDDLLPRPVTDAPVFAKDILEQARKEVGLEVYPPSDDTFLLLKVIQVVSRMPFLRSDLIAFARRADRLSKNGQAGSNYQTQDLSSKLEADQGLSRWVRHVYLDVKIAST